MNKKNKKKKSRFTPMEIGVFVIIVIIIIATGFATYNYIIQAGKDDELDALLEVVKDDAYSYYEETGIKKVYIDTLIKNGYIKDNLVDGKLYNPADTKEALNCRILEIDEDYKNIKDRVIVYDKNKKYTLEDGSCDTNYLLDAYFVIDVLSGATGNDKYISIINEDKIVNFGIKDLRDNTILDDDINYTWKINNVINESNTNSVSIDTNNINDIKLVVNFTYNNTKVQLEHSYKIDYNKPVINSVSVNDSKVSVNVTDNESGINSYCISKNKSECNNWININSNSFEFVLTGSNKEYLFIKDNAGNISEYKEIN